MAHAQHWLFIDAQCMEVIYLFTIRDMIWWACLILRLLMCELNLTNDRTAREHQFNPLSFIKEKLRRTSFPNADKCLGRHLFQNWLSLLSWIFFWNRRSAYLISKQPVLPQDFIAQLCCNSVHINSTSTFVVNFSLLPSSFSPNIAPDFLRYFFAPRKKKGDDNSFVE